MAKIRFNKTCLTVNQVHLANIDKTEKQNQKLKHKLFDVLTPIVPDIIRPFGVVPISIHSIRNILRKCTVL